MAVIDIKADARRIVDVLAGGGIAIIPNDVGYALMGGSKEAVQRINRAKQRAPHKRNAMLCGLKLHRELHRVAPRDREMIDALTVDYNLPVGVVAPYDPHHPVLANVDDELRRVSTAGDTLAMLLNAGNIFDEVNRLLYEKQIPVFGSSANLTGTGPKFRVEDIQPEIREIADVIVDYGLRKFHTYQRSATILRFNDGVECLRIGSCYELIADVLKRHFGVDLPPDPGRDVLPSGHIMEHELINAA
ncbi:tRNA A37 threonylcarbamoyladenosine synthetase subunit TsaC/SUA5/YrdC [Massilia sp. PDC64]|nr:Sua5/YciO/YrdC/YwlC family protein [Massilia sp. PDC64]SDE78562.1 tRNA A37 threonylcarbamoyladenosine synthetase subunit TsaC/SUA5/YrdC [Massilia sp. PDC64]